MQAEFAEGGDLFRDTNLDNCLCSIPDETSGVKGDGVKSGTRVPAPRKSRMPTAGPGINSAAAGIITHLGRSYDHAKPRPRQRKRVRRAQNQTRFDQSWCHGHDFALTV